MKRLVRILVLVVVCSLLISSLAAYAETDTSQKSKASEWKLVSINSSCCYELAHTHDGSIIASFENGLWKKTNNSDWEKIGEFNFGKRELKGGLATSKTGEMAVISGEKLLEYKNGNWSTLKDFSSENDSFKSLKYDTTGNLLVGTFRGKVLKFKNGTFVQIGQFEGGVATGGIKFVSSPPNSETPTIVINVLHQEGGSVKSRSEDVMQYTDGNWKTIGSFNERYISAITFGQDGMPIVALTNTMVGQAGMGVLKYNGSEWVKLGENTPNKIGDSILGHHVIQMGIDKNGTLMAITKDSPGSMLWKYDNNTWSIFADINDIARSGTGDSFTSLSIGPNNEITVGTLFSGIWQYTSPEPKGVETKNTEAELPAQKGGSASIIIAIVVIGLCAGLWFVYTKRKK